MRKGRNSNGSVLELRPFRIKHRYIHCSKTTYIRRNLVSIKIVDYSDVVGASPAGAAPTTSSFSTWLNTWLQILKYIA